MSRTYKKKFCITRFLVRMLSDLFKALHEPFYVLQCIAHRCKIILVHRSSSMKEKIAPVRQSHASDSGFSKYFPDDEIGKDMENHRGWNSFLEYIFLNADAVSQLPFYSHLRSWILRCTSFSKRTIFSYSGHTACKVSRVNLYLQSHILLRCQ